MFALNEAPNTVLSAISSHTAKRKCTTFLSVLCCLPTLGVSACGLWCIGEPKCCFPENITLPTEAGLTVLIEALNKIRYIASGKDSDNFDEKTRIAWQVKTTIAVLEQVMLANHIQGGYKEVIEASLNNIRIKASDEDEFNKIISSGPDSSKATSVTTPTAPDADFSASYHSLA